MTWSVLVRLIAHEWRRNRRRSWVTLTLILLSAATWTSVSFAQRRFAEKREAYNELVRQRGEAQIAAKGRVIGRAKEVGLRLVRRPNPTGAFVLATEDALPAGWDFTPNGAEALPSYRVLIGQTDGDYWWTPEFLARIFLAGFALMLGLAGPLQDRSSGWIRALRAQPVAARLLSAGRWAGGCLTLSVLIAVWLFVMTAVRSRESFGPTTVELWILGIPAWLYAQGFLGLGIAIAHLATSEYRAWLVGLGTWLLLAVVGPIGLPVVIQILLPNASQSQFERGQRERYADAMREIETKIGKELAARVTGATAESANDLLTPAFASVERKWLDGIAEVRRDTDQTALQWQSVRAKQRNLLDRLDLVVPGALLNRAFGQLLGTGRQFAEQWEALVRDRETMLASRVFDDRPSANLRVPVAGRTFGMSFERHDYLNFGDFPFSDPQTLSLFQRLKEASSSLGLLVFWMAATAIVAVWVEARALRSPLT